MQELGELDKNIAEFEKRGVRIVVVSVDSLEETEKTQRKFFNLIVLSDSNRNLTEAVQALHRGAGPGGSNIAAPTTLLLDKAGKIRWVFRADRLIERLSPGELLAAIDEHLLAK